MQHRGPDASGQYRDGAVQLEHLRLAIIDLSERGNQPMVSRDGNYVIVYNGEVYNHMAIRNSLLSKGYVFNSTTDTETVLYGFIEYGAGIRGKLNGIVAFAIFDKEKKQVFMARDQFGIKPFYFYNHNNCFLFASELKAFLKHPSFDRTIDFNALYNYLQFLYSPTEATPFHHVKTDRHLLFRLGWSVPGWGWPFKAKRGRIVAPGGCLVGLRGCWAPGRPPRRRS